MADGLLKLQIENSDGKPMEHQLQSLFAGAKCPEIVFLNLLSDQPLHISAALAAMSQKVPLVISQTVEVSIRIVPMKPAFETLDVPDNDGFEVAVRQVFNLQAGSLEKNLPRALARYKDAKFNAVGEGIMPLLLIGWGLWRPNQTQAGAIPRVLRAWSDFCECQLSRACPSRLRILSHLALESPKEHHNAITQNVKTLRREHQRKQKPAFYLEQPARLDVVTEEELEEFFFEHAEAFGCSRDECETLTRLIFEKTKGGNYQPILEHIEQLLQKGFHSVLAKWQREANDNRGQPS